MSLLAALMFFCGDGVHADQSAEPGAAGGAPHFSQVLRWEGDPNVLYYEVTLQDSAGRTLSVTRVEKPVLRLSLSPGEYRYRIVLYNLLHKPEVTLPWRALEIIRAEAPRIAASAPKMWFLEDLKPTLSLSGEHLMAGATAVLRPEAAGGPEVDAISFASHGGTSATATFPRGQLAAGEYTLEITNPGGLAFELPHALLVRHMLGVPSGLRPAAGTRFGPTELRAHRSIRFSWDPVPGAVRYIFRLRRAGRAGIVVGVDSLRDPSYLLEDLTVLDRGDYLWSVEAQGEERGRGVVPALGAAKAAFTIVLPQLAAPANIGGDVFYGR